MEGGVFEPPNPPLATPLRSGEMCSFLDEENTSRATLIRSYNFGNTQEIANCASNVIRISFYRAMLCINAVYAVTRCLSVRPSRS